MANNILGDNIGFIELVDFMGNDLKIVNSARVSNGKKKYDFTEEDEKLIKYLIENDHSSPLEHVVFTFHIKVPMFIVRQWERHRTWKYWSLNEISRRYTSENIEYYVPTEFRKQALINKQASDGVFTEAENKMFRDMLIKFNEYSINLYNFYIDNNVAREMARMVLPFNLYTEFYGTVDLWNLFHFIRLRDHPHAQKEIVLYAKETENLILDIIPSTFRSWKTKFEKEF